jgi:hypothetical protein
MMQLFRLMARRAGRIATIVLLVGAIFGFGHFMTPRSPDVFARVFEDMGSVLNSPGMPAYMNLEVEEGQVQEVYLNGNTLQYTLNRTHKRLDTLLDYYENLYQSEKHEFAPKAAREALLKTVKDPKDREEQRRRIAATDQILNERFVRFDGKNWGGFSTFITGKEGKADYNADMVQRFRKFKESGDATELGEPKLLVAFEDASAGDVQYFNVWPAGGFDFKSVRPQGEDDAPGYDLADIPRPYDSQRLITFGQSHMGADYQILLYRGGGTIEEVAAHYATALSDEGWSISATHLKSHGALDGEFPSLLFTKEHREAYIAMTLRDGESLITSTVVVLNRRG